MKYGTCAAILPACMTWTTCQPPSPSGTWICEATVPLADAVVFPSGMETKLQHVPVQLTRLPTTVDHWSSTGAFGVSPEAVTPTFVITAPLVELRVAVALVAAPRPAASSVVREATVGATFAGQSILAAGRP